MKIGIRLRHIRGDVRAVTAIAEEADALGYESLWLPDRLIMPLINEAALCLQEHIASPADIDLSMVAGTGMTYGGQRMGPLAVADLIGSRAGKIAWRDRWIT